MASDWCSVKNIDPPGSPFFFDRYQSVRGSLIPPPPSATAVGPLVLEFEPVTSMGSRKMSSPCQGDFEVAGRVWWPGGVVVDSCRANSCESSWLSERDLV